MVGNLTFVYLPPLFVRAITPYSFLLPLFGDYLLDGAKHR